MLSSNRSPTAGPHSTPAHQEPGRRSLSLAFAAAVSIALGAAGARSEPASAEDTVDLSYQVPESCPPSVVFVDAVRARAPRTSFDTSIRPARFELVLEVARLPGNNNAGTFTLTGPGGARVRESLNRTTCSELVYDLAGLAAQRLAALSRAPAPSSSAAQPAPSTSASAAASVKTAPASSAPRTPRGGR